MVSGPYDQDPPDDGGGDPPGGRGLRDHRRPDPRFLPQSGHRRHLRSQAPDGHPQPHRHGGPRPHQGLGRAFQGKGLFRDPDRLQKPEGDRGLFPRPGPAAGGKAPPLRGEGHGRQAPEGHGGGHSQRGEIHLHQSGGRAQGHQGGEPPRRHPGQAVGHRGPGPSAAGHPRHPLAQVRGPGGGAAPGLDRSRQGRHPGHRDPGRPPHGSALAGLPGGHPSPLQAGAGGSGPGL